MRACERIAATITFLSPTSETQAGDYLTPDAGYARQVSAAIGQVDELRVALRTGMRAGAAQATVTTLATNLAHGLAGAARSLSVAQPPTAAASAHAALLESLLRSYSAYAALAAAIRAGSPPGYTAAGARVYEAEAALGQALKNFASIGYK
jgi:hypothetical protein